MIIFIVLTNSFIMEYFIIVLQVIWGILSIILFFKVWGMTNDIKRIADKIAPKENQLPDNYQLEPQSTCEEECDNNENKEEKIEPFALFVLIIVAVILVVICCMACL